MTSAAIKILLVEDEALILGMLEDTLSEAGYGYISTSTPDGALQLLETEAPTTLVTDINLGRGRMPGGSSLVTPARKPTRCRSAM